VPTTRDQLIADWRKRLDAASEVPAEPTSRAAWLVRLRLRLYRFLLSLYGEGDWTAPADAVSVRRGSPDPAAALTEGLTPVECAPEPPLTGKPAKTIDSIRAVLNSVAVARENRPNVGPLAAGINRDDWVLVASVSRGFDPELTAAALLSKGIVSRVLSRQHDVTVEVRAYHETGAVELITSQCTRLALRPRSTEANLDECVKAKTADLNWTILFFGLGISPLLGVLLVLLLGLAQPGGMDIPTMVELLGMVAYVWIGSFSIVGLIYLLAGLRRKSQRSPLNRIK